jgi:hypothetical protein
VARACAIGRISELLRAALHASGRDVQQVSSGANRCRTVWTAGHSNWTDVS